MAAVAFTLMAPSVARGQVAISTDEIQHQGDALSDQVSGFFRRMFGSGSPDAPRPQMTPSQPAAPTYTPPSPVYYPPAQPSRGRQSSASSAVPNITRKAQTSKPAVSRPKQPAEREPANKTVAKAKSRSQNAITKNDDTSKGGVFTSAKRPKTAFDTIAASTNSAKTTEPTKTPVKAPSETPPPAKTASNSNIPPGFVTGNTVVKDPLEPVAKTSPAYTPPTPAPPKKEEPPVPSSAGAPAQNYPVGTLSSKPGRVVSPYPPNHELDVRGLPSGSLALDPVTQKVFKVP